MYSWCLLILVNEGANFAGGFMIDPSGVVDYRHELIYGLNEQQRQQVWNG